ncbi:MAG: heat-inducible transcription repressor HrcA [Deltaproteobacteria bacterium]|jgi:heat-inducible transcriptional repressor|nr:heat-inducible transcription repressor HrcA [Deltaproteobacteria bacterium]
MGPLLSDRSRDILEAIIEEHIATAQPVGSKAITQRPSIGLSSASVRNVMSELEDSGFLTSPHTSAGRIPTDKGYRYYVDSVLKVNRLNRQQKTQIEAHYRNRGLQMGDLLRETSRTLSAMAHYTGLVMIPRIKSTVFRHIEFVKLSSRKILAVFVTQSGLVQNRLIEHDEDLSHHDLEQITNYLNQTMAGLSIREAQAVILSQMAKEKALYDHLLQRAFRLSQVALDDATGGDVIIEGTSHLFEQPEFNDLERMKRIFQTFEQKRALINLLDLGLQAKGVRVLIGSETEHSEISGCSLITSAYYGKAGTLGTLGILGPSRMPYSSIIPIVDYTASLISRMLEDDSE